MTLEGKLPCLTFKPFPGFFGCYHCGRLKAEHPRPSEAELRQSQSLDVDYAKDRFEDENGDFR